MVIDILQTHLEYKYLRLGQGTLRELGHGPILNISDYRPLGFFMATVTLVITNSDFNSPCFAWQSYGKLGLLKTESVIV